MNKSQKESMEGSCRCNVTGDKIVSIYVKYYFMSIIFLTFALIIEEDWQSDRMRWTRNPVYPLQGIGGLNPSSSAFQT